MNDFPLQKFIGLVQFDQQIQTLEHEQHQLQDRDQHLQKTINSLQQHQEDLKRQLQLARKDVDNKELEMKILDEKIQEKKSKMEQASNTKELQALYQEVERLKNQQHSFEEILLNAWQHYEATQRRIEQELTEDTKTLTSLNQERSDLEQHQLKNKDILLQFQQERPEKEVDIPTAWLEKYSSMRSRVADPIVPVVNNCCSACFYKVSQQDLIQLKHRTLVQCKDCFRLLYDASVVES